MNTKVTKTVYVNEFDTDALVMELRNRIDDHLNDPEPQHDPVLESWTESYKIGLLHSLKY